MGPSGTGAGKVAAPRIADDDGRASSTRIGRCVGVGAAGISVSSSLRLGRVLSPLANTMNRIFAALKEVVDFLEARNQKYALIGGLAVGCRSQRTNTRSFLRLLTQLLLDDLARLGDLLAHADRFVAFQHAGECHKQRAPLHQHFCAGLRSVFGENDVAYR